MKKTFTKFLLLSLFIALLLSICAYADNSKYVIDAQSGYAGDTVEVNIYLENNPGFGGIAYEVIYDSELLSVTDYEKKLGKDIGVDSGDRLDGRIIFQYAGIRNVKGDEPLVTFNFKISENADTSKAVISVINQENSSFYYGGENGHTEINFDIKDAEGYIEILQDEQADAPIEDETKNETEENQPADHPEDQPEDLPEEEPEDEPSKDDEATVTQPSGENNEVEEPDDQDKEQQGEETNKESNDDWVNPFSDLKESDWYFEAVKNANIKGIINGVTPTEFAPNQNITRAMFVTMLYRLEVLPRVRMHNFSDVPFGAWYYNPVAWASEEGIVNGITPTEFCPDVGITREQLATMLFRYAVYKGMDAVTLEENLDAFEDSQDVSEYAVTALNWAVGQGLINGTTPTTLSPLATATRAQVAVILDRFLKLGI